MHMNETSISDKIIETLSGDRNWGVCCYWQIKQRTVTVLRNQVESTPVASLSF